MKQEIETKSKPIRKLIKEKEKKLIIHIKTDFAHKQSVKLKIPFPYLQKTFTFNFDNEYIEKIKELSNKRIGILLENSLRIYNIDSFKKLEEIKIPNLSDKYSYGKEIFDFIELKNSDLVLWSPEYIFFYQKTDDKYNCYQKIFGPEEHKEIKDNYDNCRKNCIDYSIFKTFKIRRKKYRINSIYELSNSKLAFCVSFGLLIYTKEKEKYVLESIHPMLIDVIKLMELDKNKLILFRKYYYLFSACPGMGYSQDTHSISIYNIETKEFINLATNEGNKNYEGKQEIVSFMVKSGLLLVRYGDKIDIYDIKNNMLLKNHYYQDKVKGISRRYYFDSYKISKDLNGEADLIFLCDYFYNLIIAKNSENKAKIFMLKDNSLKYIKDFDFELNYLHEIIKLKNNKFLMYSGRKLFVLNQK